MLAILLAILTLSAAQDEACNCYPGTCKTYERSREKCSTHTSCLVDRSCSSARHYEVDSYDCCNIADQFPHIPSPPPVVPLPPPVVPPKLYNFRVDTIDIREIRSQSTDTLHISIRLDVTGAEPYVSVKTLGDHKAGEVFNPDIAFIGIPIPNTDVTVTFTYLLLNAGKNPSEDELKAAITQASGLIVSAAGMLGQITSSIASLGFNILFADCDGAVAAGSYVTSGLALNQITAGIVKTEHSSGYTSPWGCGDNSDYYITYSIRQ